MWYLPSDVRKGNVAALSGRTVIAVKASGTRIAVVAAAVPGAVADGGAAALGSGVATFAVPGAGEHPTRTIPVARTAAVVSRCRTAGFARVVPMALLGDRRRTVRGRR
jgi:hypothetical protein